MAKGLDNYQFNDITLKFLGAANEGVVPVRAISPTSEKILVLAAQKSDNNAFFVGNNPEDVQSYAENSRKAPAHTVKLTPDALDAIHHTFG